MQQFGTSDVERNLRLMMPSRPVSPSPVNEQVHPMIVRLLAVAELLNNPQSNTVDERVNIRAANLKTATISAQKSGDKQAEV
jgi:hypothetical protein